MPLPIGIKKNTQLTKCLHFPTKQMSNNVEKNTFTMACELAIMRNNWPFFSAQITAREKVNIIEKSTLASTDASKWALRLSLSFCQNAIFSHLHINMLIRRWPHHTRALEKNAISYLGSQLSFFDKRSTRVFKFDTARGFMAKSHFPPSVARTHHLLWRSLLKRTAVPHRYRMHNSLCVHVKKYDFDQLKAFTVPTDWYCLTLWFHC